MSHDLGSRFILSCMPPSLGLIALLCVSTILSLLLRCAQVVYSTHRRERCANKRTVGRRKLAIFLGSGQAPIRPILTRAGGHTAEMIRLLATLDFDRYHPRIYLVSSGDAFSNGQAQAIERAKAKTSTELSETRLYVMPKDDFPSYAAASLSCASAGLLAYGFAPRTDELPSWLRSGACPRCPSEQTVSIESVLLGLAVVLMVVELLRRAGLFATDSSVADYQIIEVPRARRVHQSFFTAPFTTAQTLIFCVRTITLRRHFADIVLMNGPGTCVPICLAVVLRRLIGLPAPKLVYIESFARVSKLSLSAKLVRPIVDRFIVQWPQLADSLNDRSSPWLAKAELRRLLL